MSKFQRRDFLKGLATLPVLCYFGFSVKDSIGSELGKKEANNLEDLGIKSLDAPRIKLVPSQNYGTNKIRVGLVGNGWRGPDLMRALGYAHPEWIKKNTKDGKYNEEIVSYLEQEDLNVEFAAVCDTFTKRAVQGVETSMNEIRPGKNQGKAKPAKSYPTYREMIADKEIDAIIIATPDHWHAQMAIDAAKAGKHVYLEKPMTHTIEEAIELRNTVKSSGIVFQLGHQNRQQMSYKIANELVRKNMLGIITQIETYTNRNSDHGAWIRDIDKLGTLETINWKEFLGKAPYEEFNPDHYFNWQRFNNYGTSVTGNQFTHAYDCVNQIMGLGIPESVVALGGIYHYKDDRQIPDVFNAIFNYPNHKLTLTYDCTLKNNRYRETLIMGADASMLVDLDLKIYKDSTSKRYDAVTIDPSKPLYMYVPDPNIDALSSATSRSYIRMGYGRTLIDGKKLDTTYLHMKEWIDAIRSKGMPSCNIDQGFEESVTFNMANISYEKKRHVSWDTVNEKVVLS